MMHGCEPLCGSPEHQVGHRAFEHDAGVLAGLTQPVDGKYVCSPRIRVCQQRGRRCLGQIGRGGGRHQEQRDLVRIGAYEHIDSGAFSLRQQLDGR